MSRNLERTIAYSFPLISILFEILKSFSKGENQLLAARNYAFMLFTLYIIIKYFKTAIRSNIFLLLLMAYLAGVLISEGASLSRFNRFSIAFDAKMLLPVGFILTSTYSDIRKLHKIFLFTNILFVLSILAFSALGIGTNVYGGTSGFKVGYFTFSAIYIGSFLLIIMPNQVADADGKWKRIGLLLLACVTLIILILSVRRTSIVLVLLGMAVFVFQYRNYISRITGYALAAVIGLVLLFPLYQDTLMKQMESRARIFGQSGALVRVEDEMRWIETLAVWSERIGGHDFGKLMMGDHLFDSVGRYSRYVDRDRPLHLDFNILLHGSGLIGLTLWVLFYFRLLHQFLQQRVPLGIPQEKMLITTYFAILVAHVFLVFSGGMLTLTFNLISFLYLGAILGLFRHQHESNDQIEMRSKELVAGHRGSGGWARLSGKKPQP
ncbi:MAG: hypothetical protein ACKORJ_07500 [Bacteroidota bacterium]